MNNPKSGFEMKQVNNI